MINFLIVMLIMNKHKNSLLFDYYYTERLSNTRIKVIREYSKQAVNKSFLYYSLSVIRQVRLFLMSEHSFLK